MDARGAVGHHRDPGDDPQAVEVRTGLLPDDRRAGVRRGGPGAGAGRRSGLMQHGLSYHPLYGLWKSIKRRCLHPNSRSYPHYGGRGISIHPAWVHDAKAFITWIEENLGPRPDGMSLDRVDNDGNYEPGNLRWATSAEQQRNRRTFSSTGFKGVAPNGEGWMAQIHLSKKLYYLGTYTTPEE